jgi:hypothetical protein
LILFFRSEVVLDVESFSNFFWGFALDHVGDSLATDIEKWLDIKIIGSLIA